MRKTWYHKQECNPMHINPIPRQDTSNMIHHSSVLTLFFTRASNQIRRKGLSILPQHLRPLQPL